MQSGTMQYKKDKTTDRTKIVETRSVGAGGKQATSMKSYKIIKRKNRVRSLNQSSVKQH